MGLLAIMVTMLLVVGGPILLFGLTSKDEDAIGLGLPLVFFAVMGLITPHLYQVVCFLLGGVSP